MDKIMYEEGTTPVYVFSLIVPIVLTSTLALLLNLYSRNFGFLRKFFTEFIVLVYTVVFNVTILSDYIFEVLAFLSLLTVNLVLLNLRKWVARQDIEQDPFDPGGDPSRPNEKMGSVGVKARTIVIPAKQLGYVTMLRATTFLITAVCILAVDFRIFPAYSSKTHTYGFSLMDVGIGLFVCSISMVLNKPPLGHYMSLRNLLRLLWNICPFIVLGVGRSVVIKQIDYHQAVSEYGLHWNAFLTLGCTKFVATLISSFVPRTRHLMYLAVFILVLHEVVLQNGVADFVLDRTIDRETFFRANREGIVSIPGFVGLQLAIMYLGKCFRSKSETMTLRELLKKCLTFSILSAILWAAVYIIHPRYGVSRRICSAGYVVWILGVLTAMVALFMLLELFAAIMMQYKNKDRNWSYVPLIMQSINYNGLFFFLMANVLTGMVNMSIDTTKSNKVHSLLVLMIYMLINCMVVSIFYVKGFRIKFW